MDAVNLDKSSFELFKQAIEEGLSNKFDSIVNSYTEEIICSEKHKLAMRTIVYGKLENAPEKKQRRLKSKHIIAIIVAAMLLLTSCGIIFRHKIREIFRGEYVRLDYGEDVSYGKMIEDVYTLTYLPEGYSLKREIINKATVNYKYVNENDEFIIFEQSPADSSFVFIDDESAYDKIDEIESYDVYRRISSESYVCIYSDEKYMIMIRLSSQLSNEELIAIIEGIEIKQ